MRLAPYGNDFSSLCSPSRKLAPSRLVLTGGLGYPSTIGGQYGLGAAGSAPTSVSTSSQLVSPWFPSLPATYCSRTFLLTIEGTPRGDGDKNNKIEPSDNNDRKGNNGGGDNDDDGDHHKNSKDSGPRETSAIVTSKFR